MLFVFAFEFFWWRRRLRSLLIPIRNKSLRFYRKSINFIPSPASHITYHYKSTEENRARQFRKNRPLIKTRRSSRPPPAADFSEAGAKIRHRRPSPTEIFFEQMILRAPLKSGQGGQAPRGRGELRRAIPATFERIFRGKCIFVRTRFVFV